MKILNLYAGIGGNRKLWGDDHQIIAVENNIEIAKIYRDNFPNDTVIVGDAHNFLLEYYYLFDFIWTSPPCPTHSNARYWSSKGGMYDIMYPNMSLYQEIILLKHFFKGSFVVENVIPYYEPLIKPSQKINRHYFWSNFKIEVIKSASNYFHTGKDAIRVKELLGFNLDDYSISDKTKILRNCVIPETGKHILDCALDKYDSTQIYQGTLFGS